MAAGAAVGKAMAPGRGKGKRQVLPEGAKDQRSQEKAIASLRSAVERVLAADPGAVEGGVTFGALAGLLEQHAGISKRKLIGLAQAGLVQRNPADAFRHHCADLVTIMTAAPKRRLQPSPGAVPQLATSGHGSSTSEEGATPGRVAGAPSAMPKKMWKAAGKPSSVSEEEEVGLEAGFGEVDGVPRAVAEKILRRERSEEAPAASEAGAAAGPLEAGRPPEAARQAEWPAELPMWLSKQQLQGLPLYAPELEIVLVNGKNETAVDWEQLKRSDVLGFDTETKPNFRKGAAWNPPCILQLATDAGGRSRAYVFQLFAVSAHCLQELSGLLRCEVKKVGRDVKSDIRDLERSGLVSVFAPAGICDLEECLRPFALRATSLQQLVAIFLGRRLAKSQQTSNWAKPDLTKAQLTYAALDALAALEIYRRQQQCGFL